jgi:uncharacterized FAD-dependent dehydrogenase
MAAPLPPSIEVTLGLDEIENPQALRAQVARHLHRQLADVPALRVARRAIDARGGKVRFRVQVELAPAVAQTHAERVPREVGGTRQVAIVGDGPAGLFCAYELACSGIASVIVERGKMVQPRRHDLKSVLQGKLNLESNYCFGEGGAGTYSDGKLYTRATKRGDVRRVLEILIEHGAPEDIGIDARPHIGSNRLPKVISALRGHLSQVGVAFRFESKAVGLDIKAGAVPRAVRGVRCADGTCVGADAVVLATGHSARDVYDWLIAAGVRLEPKSFALGVRCEHPQSLINRIQYGSYANHPRLPNAAYQLTFSEGVRAAFSFCMCPGGFIVPATTQADAQVVNGMSLSRRDSPFANSGIVASIHPEDWQAAGFDAVLGGIELQRAVEEAAFKAGAGSFKAPAARLTDFMDRRGSSDLPRSSYQPGLTSVDLDEVLAAARLPIADWLRQGFAAFARQMRGYIMREAVLLGVESRTSSPVRIPRDPETMQHPDMRGLFPVGEGAGYAGGIVSAALDGMRAAEIIRQDFSNGA